MSHTVKGRECDTSLELTCHAGPKLESTAVTALPEQNDVFDSNFSDLYVPKHTPENDLPVENSHPTLSSKVSREQSYMDESKILPTGLGCTRATRSKKQILNTTDK